jgi:hypothetical protein
VIDVLAHGGAGGAVVEIAVVVTVLVVFIAVWVRRRAGRHPYDEEPW